MVDNAIPLAQARENSTNAVSVHAPPTQHRDKVETIMLCNTTASTVTFRLFFDADGTTYDETTALFWDSTLPPNSTLTLEYDRGLYMANDLSNLAYRSSVANAITISVWGVREFRNQ